MFKEKSLFPFFDNAYQGFVSGNPNTDAFAVSSDVVCLLDLIYFVIYMIMLAALVVLIVIVLVLICCFICLSSAQVRLFAEAGLNMVVACSFSKNFGLYGERVGAIHVITDSPQEITAVCVVVRVYMIQMTLTLFSL